MLAKFKNTFFWLFALVFVILIIKNYFSEENIILINKSRSSYSIDLLKNINKLPVLKNDTNDIIVYKNDLEEFKKKRKERFFEKLIINIFDE